MTCDTPAKPPTDDIPHDKYKPHHTDYTNMSSPEHEELKDTQQIIDDSILAREMSHFPSPLTQSEELRRTKQIVRDGIIARQLSKEDTL